MSETVPKCQRCGTPLPPDAPEGLCPRCLVALNLATQTDVAGETGPGGTSVNKPPPAPPLPPAEIAKLFPQLEILECLGRGGMGAVYKARQPRLDRFVALKILSPEKQDDPKFTERFEREARALARLSHPNIVTVYDFGQTQGNCYLLMEFVDGLTLRQLFHTRKLSPPEALNLVPKICEALQYAHNEGIVHRDIKPENILLDKKGQVKIADFGIAKIIGQTSSDVSLTGAKDVVGTPHYMAPEQIEKPATVDHRADIYSLGVVFYEMLTGELPLGKFQPPSSRMHGIQIDVRLDEVVLHALEKEPERRYQQASQVKTAVETITGSPAAPSIQPRAERGLEARTNRFQIRVLWCSLIVCLIGLPVGIILRLPLVWGLSIAGLVLNTRKLVVLNWNERPSAGLATQSPRRSWKFLAAATVVLAVGAAFALWLNLDSQMPAWTESVLPASVLLKHRTTAATSTQVAPSENSEPLLLDLSSNFQQKFVNFGQTNADSVGIAGRQVFDGVPFEVDGRVLLYGRNFTQTYSITSPDQVQIGVGRKFDELHLLHGTFFADVDGQEIAFIRLNYSDGTTVELPICYGAQVRDFQRHRTEEKELLSDPNSKIIWRGPGMRSLLSTQRLFKSRLINPIPEKTVTTMDFVSTRKLASYFFVAATVVDRDPSRPVTPPCPSGEPERHFDGAIVIRVLDDTTGRPIKGAQVQSGMDDVDGAQGTGAPLHTSTKGEAVVRYPAGRETNISVVVQMQGYHGKTAKWTQNFPDHAVFRLTPVPPENSSPSTVYGNLPVEPASDHVFTPEVVPPAQVVAETIRNKVGRDLNTVGASYDDLRVTIAVMRENATPFKVSYRGLRNFKWGDGATPAANGEFIMEYIGASQWQGKLGGMEFTVPVGQADNFTLPFINDPPVIGEWESVDFVTDIAGFNPDQPAWKGKFFFTGLTFLENGSTTLPSLTWTRDVVINREDKTASRYEIREIKGQSYLFFEWKSGDVTISGMKPHYYVLKKAAE